MGRKSARMQPVSGPWATDRAVAALARSQWGVVTRPQMLGLGLGEGAVRHRLRAHRLRRLHRGVYAVGHDALRAEGRWMAAVLACGPGAVLGFRSGAASGRCGAATERASTYSRLGAAPGSRASTSTACTRSTLAT